MDSTNFRSDQGPADFTPGPLGRPPTYTSSADVNEASNTRSRGNELRPQSEKEALRRKIKARDQVTNAGTSSEEPSLARVVAWQRMQAEQDEAPTAPGNVYHSSAHRDQDVGAHVEEMQYEEPIAPRPEWHPPFTGPSDRAQSFYLKAGATFGGIAGAGLGGFIGYKIEDNKYQQAHHDKPSVKEDFNIAEVVAKSAAEGGACGTMIGGIGGLVGGTTIHSGLSGIGNAASYTNFSLKRRYHNYMNQSPMRIHRTPTSL